MHDIQQSIEDPASVPSRTDQVAALFRARPGEWIDWRDIAAVGGQLAWRTRVSEVRTSLGLRIDNRQRRVKAQAGRAYVVSEYRCVVMTTEADL